jgi:DNA adenine methylase
MDNRSVKARPVLKWAGGKRQLAQTIDDHLPPEVKNGTITTYVEPMFGGGAVFFHMKEKYGASLKNYFISDYNWDLFVLYSVIKTDVEDLIKELKLLSQEYLPLPPTQQGEKTGQRISMYLRIREEYNHDDWLQMRYEADGVTHKKVFNKKWIRRAAMTIFLNRTCFNGLYRVNSSGKFNVPHGRYAKPDIVNAVNLRAVSSALVDVEISVGSYAENLEIVDEHSFVYFDPPYRPLPGTASFTTYHKAPFGDEQQRLLCECFEELHRRGAKLMLSNSDPKNTDESDNFFDDLYNHQDFSIHRVGANRNINSDGAKRGQVFEILVTNYEVD